MRREISNGKDIVELLTERMRESHMSKPSFSEFARFNMEVVQFMRRYAGTDELTDLIDGLNEEDPYVRWCVVFALGRLGPGRAVRPLVCALKDRREDVRKTAAQSLKTVCRGEPSDEAVEALISGMKDPDPYVRSYVIEALGGLKSAKAMALVPDLIRALSDDVTNVRRAAAASLNQITGKTFFFSNTNPQKWSSWWEERKDRLIERV